MPITVYMGKRELVMGTKYLAELRDSNDILDDDEALRSRLDEEGYLLIRGFHNRDQVLAARLEVLHRLHAMCRLAPETPIEEGIIGPDNKGAFLGAAESALVADCPNLVSLVNDRRVMDFFTRLLGGEAMTYDYKWPRAVARGENTGAHYDIVYMGRGTKNVYTLWTPLGDVSLDMGPLCVCLGSQHFERIKATYGQMDVDRDNVLGGHFTNDPYEIVDHFGGQWATAEFAAGDAIIFGMYLLHGSLNNTSNRYRLSIDTRYQLKSEPADERWVGRAPKGHYAWGKGNPITIKEARQKWGV